MVADRYLEQVAASVTCTQTNTYIGYPWYIDVPVMLFAIIGFAKCSILVYLLWEEHGHKIKKWFHRKVKTSLPKSLKIHDVIIEVGTLFQIEDVYGNPIISESRVTGFIYNDRNQITRVQINRNGEAELVYVADIALNRLVIIPPKIRMPWL